MKSETSLDRAQMTGTKMKFLSKVVFCLALLLLAATSADAEAKVSLRAHTPTPTTKHFLSICKTSARNETLNPFFLSGPLTPVYTTIQKFRWRFWKKPAEEKEEKFDALPIIAARHAHHI
jgi:hypothetical protein